MIWKIARKEFHNNLLTFRFTFGTLILILLILAITLASVKGYKDLNQEYLSSLQKNENQLRENRVYSTLEYAAIKSPEVMSILNVGVTNRLSRSVHISLREIPSTTKKYSQENPLLNIFPSLDLTLVYKIVISLIAMLFAFDAISGEKAKGTLSLLLAQRISRIKIMVGKYLGNMLTLTLSFSLSMLVAFIIIVIQLPDLKGADWIRMVFFAVFTLLYISVFFTLGLIVTSLTKKPSHTLIFCLFIWIFLVIIVPNLSTYLATVIKTIPSEKAVDTQISQVYDQTREKIREWNKENRASISLSGSMDTEEGMYYFLRLNKSSADHFKKLVAYTEPLFKERTEETWRIKQDYYKILKNQEKLATVLNRMSPSGLYQEATEIVSRTDISNYERFIQQAFLYREAIFDYLNSRDAFNSLRFFTTMEEKDILPQVSSRKSDGSYFTSDDYPPLDLSNFPRFSYRKEGLVEIFSGMYIYLVIFIFINLILLIGSAVAFNFYDVR
jgi:ABC-type transport system involved in multi-copper enzyme maturation permease subunit